MEETIRKQVKRAYENATNYPMWSPGWEYWTSRAHGLERLLVPGARIFAINNGAASPYRTPAASARLAEHA